MTISKTQISLAGEFAVLSQLALHGFDANMTLGNTKSVDILLSHPQTKVMRRLEVKTHINNKPFQSNSFGYIESKWRMDKKHESIIDKDLFYCFVSIASDTNSFGFYIVPSDVVAKFVTESHKYWLKDQGGRNRKDSNNRSFMLGDSNQKYKFKLPFSQNYQDRWDLLMI